MSQSQIHKTKKGLKKLETLFNKTLRRIDMLKRNAAEQKQFIEIAQAKLSELESKNDTQTNVPNP